MASYHQRNRGLIYYAGSNFFPLKEVIKLFFYYLCLIGGRNFAKIIQYGNGDQFFFCIGIRFSFSGRFGAVSCFFGRRRCFEKSGNLRLPATYASADWPDLTSQFSDNGTCFWSVRRRFRRSLQFLFQDRRNKNDLTFLWTTVS